MSISAAAILSLTATQNASAINPTVTVEPESSATWPAGTNFGGFVSQTTDPTAPFSSTSVQFKGWNQTGGSSELLPGSAVSRLVYRYRLDYSQIVSITSIVIQGQAFNGPDSVLRLLDSNRNVIASTATVGGNTFETIVLNTPGVVGQSFFLDEFDTSTTWRYRSDITINASLAPPAVATQTLITTLQGLALPAGTHQALSSTLRSALASISEGDSMPAINQLQAFINQVNALLLSGRLTSAEAVPLIGAAQGIVQSL